MKQPFHQGKPYNYKTQQATCLHVVFLGNRQRLKRAPKGEQKQDAAKSVAGIKHKHINNVISTQVGSPWIGVFVSKNRLSAHLKRNTVSTSKEIECPLQKRHIKKPSFCFMIWYTAAVVSWCRDSHYEDKTVIWPSWLYDGDSWVLLWRHLYIDARPWKTNDMISTHQFNSLLEMIIKTALNIYAKNLQIRFTNLAPVDFIYLIHMYGYYICIYICVCVFVYKFPYLLQGTR